MPRLNPETVQNIHKKIEETALDLFIRKGYAATTTREIANAAGFTAGALYSHYPSKDALFEAVVTRRRRQLADDTALRDVIHQSKFPYDIPELARAIQHVIRHNRAYWMLWYIDVLEFEGKHFKSQLAPKALLGQRELQARFDELRTQGVLRIEPELAFVMVYMHLFNYFLIETVFGGDEHYGVREGHAIDAIADVFMHGMLREPAAAKERTA
ncbi:MAG: TetR/AcrR family transcriptional regulator [Kofleriaceae bacterium]